jgi:hypothetical protein
MLGPIHAVGHQLNGRRIHQVDHPLETEGKEIFPKVVDGGGSRKGILRM